MCFKHVPQFTFWSIRDSQRAPLGTRQPSRRHQETQPGARETLSSREQSGTYL